MIHSSYGNLFDKYSLSVNSDHLHIIVHGCNAQGRMGSGLLKNFVNVILLHMKNTKKYMKLKV
jgi:hypothetical protein